MVKPTNNISFTNALKFLNEFRYKKKVVKNERTFFKMCNFIVLSRKRVNKVFEAFDSLEKLITKVIISIQKMTLIF